MTLMRDYQRHKNNKYILPRAVWHKTLWEIRDYYRMTEEAENLLVASPSSDGTGRKGSIGDPTFAKASKRERLLRRIDVIDEAKATIPDEYRKGVWDSVMYGTRYPDDADRTTYARWKSRFVYTVAVKLGHY